jgi:hypothetical protein
MSDYYYDRYYVEFSNEVAIELIVYAGKSSDGFSYLELALIELIDTMISLEEYTTPIYVTTVAQLPSIHESVVEEGLYIEGNDGICGSFWFVPADTFTPTSEFNERCHHLFVIRQEEYFEFRDFIKGLGFNDIEDIEKQGKCQEVMNILMEREKAKAEAFVKEQQAVNNL